MGQLVTALTFAVRAVTLGAMSRWPLLTVLGLSLLAGIAAAEEVRDLQVTYEHGRYHVSFDAILNAPVEKTRPLMTDPANWPRLSDIVTDAAVVEPLADGAQKVRVGFSACVWVFCKTVRKIEELRQLDDGDIVTLGLPEHSDFSYARERWRIAGDGDTTRVQYEAELVPSFYVPPFVGPYLLKNKLRVLVEETARNLEALAH